MSNTYEETIVYSDGWNVKLMVKKVDAHMPKSMWMSLKNVIWKKKTELFKIKKYDQKAEKSIAKICLKSSYPKQNGFIVEKSISKFLHEKFLP